MDITEVRNMNAKKQKNFRRKEKERKERAKITEAFLMKKYAPSGRSFKNTSEQPYYPKPLHQKPPHQQRKPVKPHQTLFPLQIPFSSSILFWMNL
jgi:hypothetical protein